jgi:ribonuclease H / adenosylcobalamin/alpha-ribazole phosphatase
VTATLLLIRHAEHTDYDKRFSGRAGGVMLSAAGEVQAERLAARVAHEPIAAVYASPRERTQATAAAVARPHALEVVTDNDLDEIDLGDWTGKSVDELRETEAFVRWNEHRGQACPPGGEPMRAVVDRVTGFARRAAIRHDGEAVVVVSHSDVIRGLVTACLGMPLDNILRFEIGPASVSRLVFGDWGARLLSLNEGAAA